MSVRFGTLAGVVCGALALCPAAQSYPHIINGYPASSGADVIARSKTAKIEPQG